MQPFTLTRPADLTGALHRTDGARYLAGGTTLVDLMRLYVEKPEDVIYIDDLPELGEIRREGDSLHIGALARMSEVADHAIVAGELPAVREALLLAASAQIRNMASIGGNLLQRTRCTYFRDVAFAACNKREPGSGCAALDGDNSGHAVLGTSPACIALYPGDLAAPLIAFGAEVLTLLPSGGTRRLPFAQLHRLPGDTPHIETSLRPGEFIAGITMPLTPAGRRSRYLKVRERSSYAFALASAAVGLELEGDHIREARVALGGIASTPWRSEAAEAVLRGRPAVRETFQAAAEAALRDAQPREYNRYKVELSKKTLVQALEMTRDGTSTFPGRRDA